MYGADIGDLEVIYKVFSGSSPEKVIWRLRGQQQISENDKWKNARVPIDMNAPHLVCVLMPHLLFARIFLLAFLHANVSMNHLKGIFIMGVIFYL